MKTPLSKTPRENRKTFIANTRLDNYRNMESRANEEQNLKGNDITHHLKPWYEVRSGKK